jgi:hypothetical protein
VSGFANAGAIPPVSAVREITTPDARTATTLRLAQISNGALICASTPFASRSMAISPAVAAIRGISPNAGPDPAGAAALMIHRWFGKSVTAANRQAHY